jgi:myo-inositol-1(or 4)-monophosphatase
MVYPAQLPDGFQDAPGAQLPEADLGGRLYLAIRPCSGTDEETPRQAQDRVARAVWDRVERMDYKRPV